MTEVPDRTQVAIIGGGPAGSLLSYMLHLEGIESVVLELFSKDHVLGRVRAGVIEHGSARILRQLGLGDRMDAEGFVHDGVNLAFAGEMLRVDFEGLVGKNVIIYGQTQLQKDLYDAIEGAGIVLLDEAENTQLHDIDTDGPRVTFEREGRSHTIFCDYVVGCDGVRSSMREYIPSDHRREFERLYPFVWVGVLSPTPPVNDELIYANHPDGFALCSMRNKNLSRYYVQGAADDSPEDWPDDRFWEALKTRLPQGPAGRLVTAPTLETIVTPLRSWVMEPMRHERLFLAGDAAHVVPPTGAKGLNLAVSDVVYLARALTRFYREGSTEGLDGYSDTALARVWKAVRFSWWMTQTMHRFPGISDDFDRRLQATELGYLFQSENAQKSLAENYVGLPL
ncbi:MAG TPA: 4-hydroxybenzoate 3-monooxygenase [Acidimicrobiia bacterium]|nr:4-hydroxybenzoate 3-monooxygenase [Acidimicrobiia bacterium]